MFVLVPFCHIDKDWRRNVAGYLAIYFDSNVDSTFRARNIGACSEINGVHESFFVIGLKKRLGETFLKCTRVPCLSIVPCSVPRYELLEISKLGKVLGWKDVK